MKKSHYSDSQIMATVLCSNQYNRSDSFEVKLPLYLCGLTPLLCLMLRR